MIFRWARDQLGTSEIELAKRLGKDPYEVLTEIAAKVNPGSDGLLFHPYLAGKGSFMECKCTRIFLWTWIAS